MFLFFVIFALFAYRIKNDHNATILLMKKIYYVPTVMLLFVGSMQAQANDWIRINQMGYLPQSRKTAVFMSETGTEVKEYVLVDAFTGEKIQTFHQPKATGTMEPMQTTYRLDFSEITTPGTYYIEAGEAQSPQFAINEYIYNGTADFLLGYMRQQRCGFNPYLEDSCHTHDGYIAYHPTKTGQHIDVKGGWHDAANYLQYTATSANAIYQMMFAYQQNPEAFGDAFDANGHNKPNGIPDIVDEIKWGLDWLNKMNPAKGEMYNQIADDRNHDGMRLPNQDDTDYGYEDNKGRPVYYCSGEKQPRGQSMNATTGVASTAGKFASCFALGAEILKSYYPDFARHIGAKAGDAYQHGVENPGVCQTASIRSPHIYEEENWVDDMQLAAAQLHKLTGDRKYLDQAVEYGRREPVTPWMGADSARHFQWYPFMNMGHYRIATSGNDSRYKDEFIRNMRAGIQRTYEKALSSPFMHGIPYVWASNSLTIAMLTQCRLYRELTGDTTYEEMEASMLDWLFGCNPWGTSMVVELPLWGDYPSQPHSAFIYNRIGNTSGGVINGPVYNSIFQNQRGVQLKGDDPYRQFHTAGLAYHDDTNDYFTNEPTMEGTACLTYYLSALQKEAMKAVKMQPDKNVYSHGGITRTDPSKKQISLIFTATDKADGAEPIIRILRKHKIKGGFFLAGEFFKEHPDIVQRLKSEGHYIGAHSYASPLYCSRHNRENTLVSKEEFTEDLLANYRQLDEAGVHYTQAPLFVAPHEYYNYEISMWTKGLGLQLLHFTPETRTHTDYTAIDMKNFCDNKEILDIVMKVEEEQGLNGHIMLTHLGADEARKDKFYKSHLEKMIKALKKKGYSFVPIREAVGR